MMTYNNTMAGVQNSGFTTSGSVAPQTPTVLAYANDLLNSILTLEADVADLRSVLLGDDSKNPQIQNHPQTLIGLLADSNSRVAMLCGELATIKNRLGCTQSG